MVVFKVRKHVLYTCWFYYVLFQDLKWTSIIVWQGKNFVLEYYELFFFNFFFSNYSNFFPVDFGSLTISVRSKFLVRVRHILWASHTYSLDLSYPVSCLIIIGISSWYCVFYIIVRVLPFCLYRKHSSHTYFAYFCKIH